MTLLVHLLQYQLHLSETMADNVTNINYQFDYQCITNCMYYLEHTYQGCIGYTRKRYS